MRLFKAVNLCFQASHHNLSNQLPKLNFLHPAGRAHATSLRLCSTEVVSKEKTEVVLKEKAEVENVEVSGLKPVEEIDLSDYSSSIATYFNFEMYADKSPLIQKYIDLGVNLHQVQKDPEKAQYLVKLSLEKIQPYLDFLKEVGVSDNDLGEIITKNPFLFKEDLDDLQVRINYLSSKKFDNEMITLIIKKCPKWLSTPVKVIDERLGYLQQTFKLKGDEVRKMVVQTPRLAVMSKRFILINIFALKEEMGLDQYSLKKLVVSEPKLLCINSYDLIATYEYLTNTMKVPLHLILNQPRALTCRRFILKERHKFLESLGKAQYCNLLPGYVNLMDLVGTDDTEFCNRIAKVPLSLFHDFIKTF